PVRPRAARPLRSWRRWAVAAAVLVALAGLTVPAYQAYRGYAVAARTVHQHELAVADARGQLDRTKEALASAARDCDRGVAAYHTRVEAPGVPRGVRRPPPRQAGAPPPLQGRGIRLNRPPPRRRDFPPDGR